MLLLGLGHVILLETKIRGHLLLLRVLRRLVSGPEMLLACLLLRRWHSVHLSWLLAEGVLCILMLLVSWRWHHLLLLELRRLLREVLLVLRLGRWDLC